MRRTTLVAIATISVGVSLFLGAIDYETHSLADLLSLENLPALVLFALIAFVLLTACYLAVAAVAGSVADLRSRLRTPGAR